MESILVVFLFLFGLLWMFFISVWEKRSPFFSLAWMIAVVGATAFVVFILATVRASYSGQTEWVQEKTVLFSTLHRQAGVVGRLAGFRGGACTPLRVKRPNA